MSNISELRNVLWSASYTASDEPKIDAVVADIESGDSPLKPVMLQMMNFVREDVAENKFKIAATHVNLIKDLPASVAEFADWDEEWFYINDLAGYFERSKNAERLKVLIEMLAAAQASFPKA